MPSIVDGVDGEPLDLLGQPRLGAVVVVDQGVHVGGPQAHVDVPGAPGEPLADQGGGLVGRVPVTGSAVERELQRQVLGEVVRHGCRAIARRNAHCSP